MKKHLLFILVFTVATAGYSQTKSFILTGGAAAALPNYSDASINGFKLAGQWEKAFIQQHYGWGIEADYINFMQTGPQPTATSKNRYHTIPLTFYGKYLIGNDKLQGYAKAGGGFQFSKISSETPSVYASDHDFGVALTAGAGIYYTLSEYLYLNVDYGFLYISNSNYNSGMINSVSLGVGFKY
jgi:opacity protein-like surface antigen